MCLMLQAVSSQVSQGARDFVRRGQQRQQQRGSSLQGLVRPHHSQGHAVDGR